MTLLACLLGKMNKQQTLLLVKIKFILLREPCYAPQAQLLLHWVVPGISPCPLGYSAKRDRLVGGEGGQIVSPHSARTSDRSETGVRQSKIVNDYFLRESVKILRRSQVRSGADQRSKSSVFSLSVAETGLAMPASAKFA